jgi:hypothetical protein
VNRPLLVELGEKHGTDKGDSNHTFRGVSYLDVYAEVFGRMSPQPRRLLEIGVLEGASLRMWREYFPMTDIWGLDINPAARQHEGHQIRIVTGSQADPAALRQVAHGEELDIVIDDGSHVVDHMVASLQMLWPRLAPGGYYVIEDTGCTHRDIFDGALGWPGMRFNPPDTNYANDRGKFMRAIEAKITDMDLLRGDCMFVHFWPMMVVLRKAVR